jgi:hypothetical protein
VQVSRAALFRAKWTPVRVKKMRFWRSFVASSTLRSQRGMLSATEWPPVFKGIHRGFASDTSLPRSAWVSDGISGFRVPEEEYRVRSYEPEFDALPVLITRRIPVSNLGNLSDEDRNFIEEHLRKNAPCT